MKFNKIYEIPSNLAIFDKFYAFHVNPTLDLNFPA